MAADPTASPALSARQRPSPPSIARTLVTLYDIEKPRRHPLPRDGAYRCRPGALGLIVRRAFLEEDPRLRRIPIADALAPPTPTASSPAGPQAGKHDGQRRGRPEDSRLRAGRVSAPLSPSLTHTESVTKARCGSGEDLRHGPVGAPELLGREGRTHELTSLLRRDCSTSWRAAGGPSRGRPEPSRGLHPQGRTCAARRNRTDLPAPTSGSSGTARKGPARAHPVGSRSSARALGPGQELRTRPGPWLSPPPGSRSRRGAGSRSPPRRGPSGLRRRRARPEAFRIETRRRQTIESSPSFPSRTIGRHLPGLLRRRDDDALIADLAQIRALKVISRTSAIRYRDSKKPIPEIARELGSKGMIEGSVVRSGSPVECTAQLIERAVRTVRSRPATANARWQDILALQGEVARRHRQRDPGADVAAGKPSGLPPAEGVKPRPLSEAVLKGRPLLRARNDRERSSGPRSVSSSGRRSWIRFMHRAGRGWQRRRGRWRNWFRVVPTGSVRDEVFSMRPERRSTCDEQLPEARDARAMIACDGEWDVETGEQSFAEGHRASARLCGRSKFVRAASR